MNLHTPTWSIWTHGGWPLFSRHDTPSGRGRFGQLTPPGATSSRVTWKASFRSNGSAPPTNKGALPQSPTDFGIQSQVLC